MVRWGEYTSMVQGGDVARLQAVCSRCGAVCVCVCFCVARDSGLSEARKAPRRSADGKTARQERRSEGGTGEVRGEGHGREAGERRGHGEGETD